MSSIVLSEKQQEALDKFNKNYNVFITDPNVNIYYIGISVARGINVFIVGLDGDFNRNKFGEILDLIPYADTCTKIHSLCKICKDGTPGIFSKRINNCKDQTQIGANDTYIPVCRQHYLLSRFL